MQTKLLPNGERSTHITSCRILESTSLGDIVIYNVDPRWCHWLTELASVGGFSTQTFMQCSGYSSQCNLLEEAKWHDNHVNSWWNIIVCVKDSRKWQHNLLHATCWCQALNALFMTGEDLCDKYCIICTIRLVTHTSCAVTCIAKETPKNVRKCSVMSRKPGWQRTCLTCICNFLTSMMVCTEVEMILPKNTQVIYIEKPTKWFSESIQVCKSHLTALWWCCL